jgi:soluble lytic murein transglycosylase-like protein
LKQTIKAIFLLVALAGWMFFPPPTTVASQKQITLSEAITNEPQTSNNQSSPAPQNAVPAKRPVVRSSVPQRLVPRPTEGQYTGRSYSKEEVQALIIQYSEQYGISPAVPLCIARLESGFNQFSKNKSSSASGVFQYLTSTFSQTDEGKSGLSVWDADANIRAAIKYMASRKSTKPWVVANKCPSL